MAGSKERERRRARDRFEQQRAARLERQRRNRKRAGIVVAVVCVLGLIAGVTTALVSGGGGTPTAAKTPAAKVSATASATASATTSASAAAVTEPAQHCTYASAAAGSVVKTAPPTSSPDYKAAYTASINTNLGPIKIDLANSKATCTVNSFVHLASAKFWNNTQCHRVSNSGGLYMLQCGDPTAKASDKLSCTSATLGTGGPGYEFANENLPTAGSSGSVTYKAGTIAMANSGGAATNGSQFFLVFKDTTLGPDYTPFGTITSGLDILQNVANAGTSCTYQAGGGVPKEKVVIDSVSISKT